MEEIISRIPIPPIASGLHLETQSKRLVLESFKLPIEVNLSSDTSIPLAMSQIRKAVGKNTPQRVDDDEDVIVLDDVEDEQENNNLLSESEDELEELRLEIKGIAIARRKRVIIPESSDENEVRIA